MSCANKHSSCQVKGLFLLSQRTVLAEPEDCFSLLLKRQLLRQLMYNSSAHSFKAGKGAGVLLGDHSAPGLAGRQLLRTPQLHFKSSQLPPPSLSQRLTAFPPSSHPDSQLPCFLLYESHTFFSQWPINPTQSLLLQHHFYVVQEDSLQLYLHKDIIDLLAKYTRRVHNQSLPQPSKVMKHVPSIATTKNVMSKCFEFAFPNKEL